MTVMQIMPTVTVLFNDCAADNVNSYSLLIFMAVVKKLHY